VDTARREPLGGGGVEWRRWPLALGPTLRVASDRLAWDVSAGPALVWLRLAGEGFDRNLVQNELTLGAFGQLQLSTRGRRWAALAIGNAQLYFGNSEAYVGQLSHRLPRAGLAVLVGARWSP